MLTGFNTTDNTNPRRLISHLEHKIIGPGSKSWKKYIADNRRIGTVGVREHVALLNMWLERFVLCGSTLGATTNMQSIAESLARGESVPLGRLLLGAVYHLLHQVSTKLLEGQAIGHIGGPWWFIQLWLHTQFRSTFRFDFRTYQFPDYYQEGEATTTCRCMSYDEAASACPGSKIEAKNMASFFESFYHGISSGHFHYFAYADPVL